jgi:ABC-2 type transport system permease protein
VRFDPTRLGAVARKEAIQLRRDPRSLMMAFLLPALLLLLFGYAITWDLHDIPTVVYDQDLSARSRELCDALRASGYFTLVANLSSPREVASWLERGRARMALIFPPDFAENLDAGRPAPLQAIVDGSDANTATIAIAYAQAIVTSYAARNALPGRAAALPIRVASRIWYNEELASRNMIVPGLVAVIMMIIAAMLTSLTISREWERGTMEQLIATPVTRVEVVVGKMIPYVAIGLADVAVASLLGVTVFHVPFRGNVALLGLLSLAFLVGSLGLGMMISAGSRTQLMAMQLSMMTTYLPAYLLSGFMFATELMPPVLRVVTHLIPARYFIVVTRGIFLKGVGAGVLWPQGLAMIAYALLGITLAIRAFRKELRA